ncbi:MAG: hypothetical protein AAGA46_07070 [Cyanobacteria bacterium P01_F01_bin.13]
MADLTNSDFEKVIANITRNTNGACKVYTGGSALFAALFTWLFGKKEETF